MLGEGAEKPRSLQQIKHEAKQRRCGQITAWKANGAGTVYAEAVKSGVLARGPRTGLVFGWGGRQVLPFRVFLK